MNDNNQIEKLDLNDIDWQSSRDFFNSLGEELDKLDNKDESYEFNWVGKRKAIIETGSPINKTLRPDVESSKDWDNTENLFIEGDNLDALKLLQESYLGKVKMIYIDPPYNTGKDFVYHDNFRANVEDYDEATGYKDEEGNIQYKKNEKTNGRYHSDWLSMMYPRLKLAKNLLSDDGVIFISIDDNEQANLKKLCDEVYGEVNFIGAYIKQSKVGGGSDSRFLVQEHEYCLVYARNTSLAQEMYVAHDNAYLKRFKERDSNGRYFWDTYARPGLGLDSTLTYDIEMPDGTKVRNRWIRSKQRFMEELKSGTVRILKKNDGSWSIQFKQYQNAAGKKPRSMTMDFGGTAQGTQDASSLFGVVKLFDYPKSVKYISELIKTISDNNMVVLDFFSGSGTTAHAVMQLNAEDGGNRKWIMVQLPEETDEKSEAYKAGYKTIPDIARERIRRAGDKIAKEHPDAKVDYGFRALKIDDLNEKDVHKTPGQYQQDSLLDSVDNIKEDRSDLDLLYGVLIKSALELNKPIQTKDIDSSKVYMYDYFGEVSGLIACFEKNISETVVKEIAKLKPLTAVFRDSSFPDSQAKINLSEHFRMLSPETKVKVI
jgi:adenine-specific DNA-methyltransferase